MMRNVILHGDCLELMHEIPDGSVDMILCDLPYGTTACSWDTIIPFEPLWSHYKRVIKDNGAIVLTASQPFTSKLIMSNLEMFKYCWVWEKSQATGHLNAKIMPMKAHEDIIVFYKSLPTYNPIKTVGHIRKVSKAKHKKNCKLSECYNKHGLTTYDSTERYPRSVIKYATDKQSSAVHSTQKPVALCEYFIKTYTNEGDTILDNCAGSGTLYEACYNLNRYCILIEKEKKFIDIINKRIENITRQIKLF